MAEYVTVDGARVGVLMGSASPLASSHMPWRCVGPLSRIVLLCSPLGRSFRALWHLCHGPALIST